MTVELEYAAKRPKFYNEFAGCHQAFQQLVAFHCGLANPSLVQVPAMFEKDGELMWRQGSFNMCVSLYALTVLVATMLETRGHRNSDSGPLHHISLARKLFLAM
ncbi:hypothetical protein PABG_12126 [Paracoccidioides brasiliensis Pb03]|nr:hypothetical protein PABG_12126 [Paracoccidioides brasiliensis Pb03]